MKKHIRLSPDSRLLIFFAGISVMLVMARCDKWIKPENDTQISTHGDDESHYTGQNCMNCHYTEGQGEGWFSLAGSMSGNFSNANIFVYDDFNQPSTATIQVDDLGNFYTTQTIDFTLGKFISIQAQGGPEVKMTDKIFGGQCNLCHGVTIDGLSL